MPKSDLGKQGGKDASYVRASLEPREPNVGFDEAPRTPIQLFIEPQGFGGSRSGPK